MHRFVWTAIICCLVCTCSRAQQTQTGTLPDAPAGGGQSQTTPQTNNPIQSSVALFQVLQQKSRVFPDLATNAGEFGAWQKFKLAANNSVSLSTIGQALVAAGFSQAINSASGYGQGADGYAKRFGADMARSASDNLFGTFLIASVLHEDPRFYVRRGLSFKETLKYAGQRLVYTRSDSGDRVINFAGLLGPLASEGLANRKLTGASAMFLSATHPTRVGSSVGTFCVNTGRVSTESCEYCPKSRQLSRRATKPPKSGRLRLQALLT
jgi:hypothetical protein